MVRSHLEVLQLIKNYCLGQVAAFAILSLLQTFRPQSAFEMGKKEPVEIRFSSLIYNYCESKKGKVHPRTGHEGPEGEWSYSSTLSLTSALDVGVWLTPRLCSFTTPPP